MSEKQNGVFQVGLNRAKYLDIANMSFIQKNYDGAKEAIDAFLGTIEDTSEPAIFITNKFDEIYKTRMMQRTTLEKKIASEGFLEQSIQGNQGFLNIDIEALHSMKAICWAAAQKYGLFYD